jgi:hypothetical protein
MRTLLPFPAPALALLAVLTAAHGFTACPARAEGTRITGVELSSGPLSAGGKLEVALTVESPAGLDLGSGSGVGTAPLESVPGNLFPNGTGEGRPLVPLGRDRFRVADLVINPFADTGPQGMRYILSGVYVIDRAGGMYELKAPSLDAEFYVDGDWQPTDIPVVGFEVRPNPNADRDGPRFTSLRIENPVVARGEELRLSASVADTDSGVLPNWAYVSVSHSLFQSLQGGQAWAENAGGSAFLLSGPRVLEDASIPDEDVTVVLLQMLDRAGNYAQLTQKDPADPFYWYSNPTGAWMTDIPVVRFRVVE